MNNKEYKDKYEHEYYGFMKSRMWDQYGDNYSGVCLCLSKSKIIEKYNIPNLPVNYQSYDDLHQSRLKPIDLNELKNIGWKEYNKKYTDSMIKVYFRKHLDYISENEYRFITFSENDNEYIDIDESLVGIIISKQDLNKKDKNNLLKYINLDKIESIFIRWNQNKVIIESLDEIKKNMEIENEILNI